MPTIIACAVQQANQQTVNPDRTGYAIIMVILSRFMLGKTIGGWRLFSVLGGFIGVLLILQPTSA